jgi:cullin-4
MECRGGQKKKLVIKAYKVQPTLPPGYLDEKWGLLEGAIQAVYTGHINTARICFETLYRVVEVLCVHRLAAELYKKLNALCDCHVSMALARLVGRSPHCVEFLEDIHRCWQDHCAHMHAIRSIFLVLDRKWVIPSGKTVLWDMGLNQFRIYFCKYSEVRQKTVEGVLLLLERERLGQAVDRMLLKGLVRMLSDLRIYRDEFEPHFLEATDKFYTAEAVIQMRDMRVAEFLVHVENRLNEESGRVAMYMDPGTRKPLISMVETRLLQQNLRAILEKGFVGIISDHNVEDLARMYKLFARVSGLDNLKAAFAAHVKRAGLQLVNDPTRDSSMVENLLQFKSKLDQLLQEACGNSDAFAHMLKESCEAFINVRQNKPAELIAKYIDVMLKVGNKGTSEEEVEFRLDQLLVLFRYINGKDVFEAFYKRDLAKRLLLGKSGSTDAEKSMLSKLKAECGSQFTNKLEGMFKDIELSKDIVRSFSQRPINR